MGLTVLAMLAFAANSVLCRLALRHTDTDALSFTLLRVVGAALVMGGLLLLRRGGPLGGAWPGALALAVYALAFSVAYVQLDTGTGALLLFGAVQLTMLAYGLLRGERLTRLASVGMALAVAGLAALLLPGASAPAPVSAMLMLLAGVAWGAYSLLGRGESRPLAATAGNFVRAIPLVLAAALPFAGTWHVDAAGAAYALLSGGVASGMGYALWYVTVGALGALRAAAVQLSVPVLAALGGIVLLGEPLTPRLAVCSAVVLGGVALVLARRRGR